MNLPPHRQLARYRLGDAVHYGLLAPEGWVRLSDALWYGGGPCGPIDSRDAVHLLAPCVPSKIVCIGLNYLEHV